MFHWKLKHGMTIYRQDMDVFIIFAVVVFAICFVIQNAMKMIRMNEICK